MFRKAAVKVSACTFNEVSKTVTVQFYDKQQHNTSGMLHMARQCRHHTWWRIMSARMR